MVYMPSMIFFYLLPAFNCICTISFTSSLHNQLGTAFYVAGNTLLSSSRKAHTLVIMN